MKRFLHSLSLFALLSTLGGCAEDGTVPECGAGGQSSWEEQGCATPVGGSCLSEAEFKKARPEEREDEDNEPDGIATIDDDWFYYRLKREFCVFPCMTEEEFRENRSESRYTRERVVVTLDEDWTEYSSAPPECTP